MSRLMHTGGARFSGLRTPVDHYNPAVHTEVIDAQQLVHSLVIYA